MKFVALIVVLLQFGQRAPLQPAETLLAPEVLRAIAAAAPGPDASVHIAGSESGAGDVVLTCLEGQCGTAARAARKISTLVAAKTLPVPARTIRVTSTDNDATASRAVTAIHVAELPGRPLQVIRGLWSTAGLGDEVVETFARHEAAAVDVRPYEPAGQFRLDGHGIPTTTIVTDPSVSNDRAAVVAAAAAYFLATLPNDGAEALLSHLTVGAHARLAEDGRRAVAQMGPQQRASADVLIMFGQAIEREQRRMRSFERFMPQPVDEMLRSRLADMEQGITSVWTSMAITSSPYVPPAERIRGRGGEDRRVPSRAGSQALASLDPPAALAKSPNAAVIVYELGNLIDGRRSISDIRDVLAAQFGGVPLPAVVDYVDRLAKSGAVTLK